MKCDQNCPVRFGGQTISCVLSKGHNPDQPHLGVVAGMNVTWFNSVPEPPPREAPARNSAPGREVHRDTSAGGRRPTAQTQKAENFQRLTELCQGNPQFLQLAGDIIYADWRADMDRDFKEMEQLFEPAMGRP